MIIFGIMSTFAIVVILLLGFFSFITLLIGKPIIALTILLAVYGLKWLVNYAKTKMLKCQHRNLYYTEYADNFVCASCKKKYKRHTEVSLTHGPQYILKEILK